MALIILTIIFFAGGFVAILYSVLALFSMLKYSRAQKAVPEKFEPQKGKPNTYGPPIAEAYCRRARILLLNERFDAALADCKRAIDINPNHAEAHVLWEHALEKELPAIPEAEPAAIPAAKEKPAVKKIKRRKKKVVAKPVPEKLPAEPPEEPPAIAVEPEKEIILEEKVPQEAVTPEPELIVEPPTEVSAETEVAPEEAAAEEPIVEPEPEEVKPSLEIEVEDEAAPEVANETIPVEATPEVEITLEPDTEEVALEPATVPEEVPVEAEPEVEPEPVEPEPTIQLEAEAEVKPIAEPEAEPAAEPEISKEAAEEEVTLDRKPLPGEEEGPLIPEDKLVTPKPPQESLLEEFDREKLKEFEEGEAGAGDSEWTRYAHKKEMELAEIKIDMNELTTSATGLKETLTDLRQAESYNLQGETNISKNLYSNAIKDFSRSLEINPNYVDALINRGSAYAQLGRFNDALMDFNHALRFEKKDFELYCKRGEIYMQNNMHDQAIKDFTAAIVLNPMFSDAYLNRGRAYSEKGMPEEAMNDFNQAIKADSDHDFGFVDRAAPSIHIDDEGTTNTEEAEKFNQQGLAALKDGKHKEALESFTKAVDLASSEADGYINRGRAFIQLGKPDEALADLNQAVLFDPLNASLYYWRAQAWKAKDNTFNLTEDLKLACEMGHEPACLEYRKLKPVKK